MAYNTQRRERDNELRFIRMTTRSYVSAHFHWSHSPPWFFLQVKRNKRTCVLILLLDNVNDEKRSVLFAHVINHRNFSRKKQINYLVQKNSKIVWLTYRWNISSNQNICWSNYQITLDLLKLICCPYRHSLKNI